MSSSMKVIVISYIKRLELVIDDLIHNYELVIDDLIHNYEIIYIESSNALKEIGSFIID